MSSTHSPATTSCLPEMEEMRKEIIELCNWRCRKSQRLGPRVRRFRDNMAIKERLFDAQDEFNNQLKAYQLVDPKVIRVPRPIDCFTHKYPHQHLPTGFLVMELAETGQKQEGDLTDSQMDQVADMVRYLATFKSTIPGCLMGDGARMYGILWEGDDSMKLSSMQQLNDWIHKRRTLWPDTTVKEFVDFGEFELVLCHLDIASRNILWPTDGGAPWLIDWESAAFLPRLFEYFQHRLSPVDVPFHERLLSRLEPLSEREEELLHIFHRAYGNSIRCYYEDPSEESDWVPSTDNKDQSD